MIGVAVVLKLDGLESDNTIVPVTVLLDTIVNEAPATLDATPLIVNNELLPKADAQPTPQER